ncbi:hypothetical protein [Lysinibacillus sp. FSL P2-0066]|uniref:hypothetical protein n=1 Tax=Lysinibacillus sp. FSL P2-0066 TaxID=2921720 RepID=UPI0030DCDF8A
MSTTVKQSSYRDIKQAYEKGVEQAGGISATYLEATFDDKSQQFVEVDEEFEEDILFQINELMPFLVATKYRLEFIVEDTNTSEKKKRKYRNRLEDLNAYITTLENIKDDIGWS